MWVNCTAGDITDEADLVWSITLPDRRQVDYRFSTAAQKKILNDRGFHDLPAIDAPVEIIQMVINNTDDINGTDGTVLECANTLTGQLLLRITLFVHGKLAQILNVHFHLISLL